MVNEPVDANDPNGAVLVYESDMGPLGLRLDVYHTTTGDTVAYISPDWTELEHRRRKRDARRDNAGREPVPLAVRSPHAAAQAARQEHDATGTRQIIDEKKNPSSRKGRRVLQYQPSKGVPQTANSNNFRFSDSLDY